jgi:hypothetical protein
MPRTIPEGFKKMLQNLEVTDLQEETVATRQKNVRAVLENDLSVLDTFLTGSYRRNTLISPLKKADVDILAVVDAKYHEATNPAALLDRTKAALRKSYKTPDISPNGQAVTITFDDFKVDVVPGFYRQGGGYLIPDTERRRWIETDPKKHVTIWTEANKAHNNELVPLIKIIKGWNKSRSLLRSFHLEALILSVLNNVTISDYPSGARHFFDKAKDKIWVKLADPAGYSDDIAAYINSKEKADAIIQRLEWARVTAAEAESLAAKGSTAAAYERWQKIFEGYFPAYG